MTPRPAGIASVDRVAVLGREFDFVWLVVAVLFLGALLIQGTALGGITLFDDRLLRELDVTRGALKFRDLLYILTSSASCLAMARLSERIGVRAIVLIGLCSLSTVMLGYSAVTSIAMVYALQALLGFSYACVHVVVLMIVLSRWFDRGDPRRGIALGVCVSGASCGAVLLSQVIAGLLIHVPWRSVFQILAVPPLLLTPLVWLVVRPPADRGAGRWTVVEGERLGFSFAVLRSPIALLLLLAIVPVFYVSASIASHVVLMLRDQGLSTTAAAGGIGTMFIAGLIGKFGSGFVLLRVRLAMCWLMAMGLMLAGSLLLIVTPDAAHTPALALIGLGWGGCFPLAQLQIAEQFPGPALPRVLGFFVVFESIGSAGGAWLTAVMYDVAGGYAVPFGVNAGMLVIGIVASVVVRRRSMHQQD